MSEMTPKRITRERLMEANKTLKKYKAGKAHLESRLQADEKWWRGHAWDTMLEQGNIGNAKRPTKWLVNVIMGKHADMVAAYPEPVILPREESDEEQAKILTSILPVILEQNEFKQVYSKQAWEKNKHGTAAYAVYWDGGKLNGLGDITIQSCDLLNVFWEPGLDDIQKSPYFFHTEMWNSVEMENQYPQLRGKLSRSAFQATRFLYDDTVNTEDKTTVIDVYYHRSEGGRRVLHYCKYVGDVVLYSTENNGTGGIYDHEIGRASCRERV